MNNLRTKEKSKGLMWIFFKKAQKVEKFFRIFRFLSPSGFIFVWNSISQFKGNKAAFRKELLEFEHKDYSQYCCEIDSWLKESKTRLNLVELEYINKMASTFKDMKGNPSIDFAKEMLVLQKNVVADKRAFRKEMLVNALSIAKYSYQFWNQANQEANHPYSYLFLAKDGFPFTYCTMRDIVALFDAINTLGTTEETAISEASYQSAICMMP